jgi:hypothetical protein
MQILDLLDHWGYQGFDSGYPGFLLWSGSALAGQNTKGGVAIVA